MNKAAANALFIVEWLTGNPSVKMTIDNCIQERMMTLVRRIARCMLFVVASQLPRISKCLGYIKIKQGGITNLEIRWQVCRSKQ